MTDGGVFCDPGGNLLRTFSAKDCFAIRMAEMNGYPVAVITGGRQPSIRIRMQGCGVPDEDVYLGSRDKLQDFNDFCARYGLDPSEVMFFGDDVPDIPVMKACGCGACPSDAADDVLAAADLVSEYPGGRGFIRHEVERVMKGSGRWNFHVDEYKKRF